MKVPLCAKEILPGTVYDASCKAQIKEGYFNYSEKFFVYNMT